MLTTCGYLLAILLAAPPSSAQSIPPQPDGDREARLAASRARARESIDRDRLIYSESQIKDIETRYRSAYQDFYPDGQPVFTQPGAAPIFEALIRDYPRSNRSGCAALTLAKMAAPAERGPRLRLVIANHSNAWCESGVQVGGLARALLAVHYAGLEQYDLAERFAQEIVARFPDAIDDAGAPLRDVLDGIRLLNDGKGRHQVR